MTIEIKPKNGVSFTLSEVQDALKAHAEVKLAEGVIAKASQMPKTVGTKVTAANKVLAGRDPKVFVPRDPTAPHAPRSGAAVKFPLYAEFDVENSRVTLTQGAVRIELWVQGKVVTCGHDSVTAGVLSRLTRDWRKGLLSATETINGAPITAKWQYAGYSSAKDDLADAKADMVTQAAAKADYSNILIMAKDNFKPEAVPGSRRGDWLDMWMPETTPESVEAALS